MPETREIGRAQANVDTHCELGARRQDVAREDSKALEYAGMAFMTFGQEVYAELARKALHQSDYRRTNRAREDQVRNGLAHRA